MACIYKIKGDFESAWNKCKEILDKSNKWDFIIMNVVTYAPRYKTKSYTYSQKEIKDFELFIDYARIDLDKYCYGILVTSQNLHENYKRTRMLSLDLAWSFSTKAIKMLMKYKVNDFVTLLSEFHKLFIFTTENFNECNDQIQVLSRIEEDIGELLFRSSIPYFVKYFKEYLYTLPEQPEREGGCACVGVKTISHPSLKIGRTH